MKLEIAILLLAAAVCVNAFSSGNGSGYDCRRRCGYSRRYVCSRDGTTYDNECMMKCNFAYKSCDGRCPCYRPPNPILIKPRPVVNYKPRQLANNYEPRQPVNSYEPRQPVNNYEPRQPVNSYEPRQPFDNYEQQQPVNYIEPAPEVNYQSVPDYDPAPVYTEPEPVYYDAAAQSDCFCGKDKDYVCGYNGETYDNECEANCDGQAKMCDGQCPCSK